MGALGRRGTWVGYGHAVWHTTAKPTSGDKEAVFDSIQKPLVLKCRFTRLQSHNNFFLFIQLIKGIIQTTYHNTRLKPSDAARPLHTYHKKNIAKERAI